MKGDLLLKRQVDGLTDGEEVYSFNTNPNAFSSDGSGQGDLWRVLGGLTPSDVPYTNAAPSFSPASFDPGPSGVPASGTIFMPSYTITPSLLCFHCPTSSVLLIENITVAPSSLFTNGVGAEVTNLSRDM